MYVCKQVHDIDDGDADWRPEITFVYFTVDFLICCLHEGVQADLQQNSLIYVCIGVFLHTKVRKFTPIRTSNALVIYGRRREKLDFLASGNAFLLP